jgi:hypothetical protein
MKIITNALSARRPDWKGKRAVKVMPQRKPGDPNPVLLAPIKKAFDTFDTFGMGGEPNSNPLERLEDRRGVRIPNRALAAMRKGAQLRLQYRDGRPSWSLGGKSLSADVAAIVIASVLVAPADAALFPDLPGQCWRMK